MTNNIDTRVKIAESDLLAALTGIVNAHLSDGIADGSRQVHPVSVVIWRNMPTPGAAIHGLTSLAVIVHVDDMAVQPFGGSTIKVALDTLSHAATMIVVRAERLAAEELDRREETLQAQLDAAQDNLDAKLETLAEYPETKAWAVPHYTRIYSDSPVRFLDDWTNGTNPYIPTPVSGDELARVRAGVSV